MLLGKWGRGLFISGLLVSTIKEFKTDEMLEDDVNHLKEKSRAGKV